MHSKTAKEIWDTLENIHERDTKVKMAKLQAHRTLFENLKMIVDEDIVAFFLRVAEVVIIMIGLGEEIKESVVVQKLLRYLPPRFNPKFFAIQEVAN